MDQEKLKSTVAPIVVSLICVVLAVHVGIANSKLNVEMVRSAQFNAEIVQLEAQLSEATAKYEKEVTFVSDLQYSFDVVRKEVDAIKIEASSLKETNTDLEARLDAAAEALNPSTEVTEAAIQQ